MSYPGEEEVKDKPARVRKWGVCLDKGKGPGPWSVPLSHLKKCEHWQCAKSGWEMHVWDRSPKHINYPQGGCDKGKSDPYEWFGGAKLELNSNEKKHGF